MAACGATMQTERMLRSLCRADEFDIGELGSRDRRSASSGSAGARRADSSPAFAA
jgi:hypothetical protein